jgi:hypothetical protein
MRSTLPGCSLLCAVCLQSILKGRRPNHVMLVPRPASCRRYQVHSPQQRICFHSMARSAPQQLGWGWGGCCILRGCNKIAEAEAAMSVNGEKWLVMHVHVQLRLDKLRGPPNPWIARLCVNVWQQLWYAAAAHAMALAHPHCWWERGVGCAGAAAYTVTVGWRQCFSGLYGASGSLGLQ